MKQATPSSPVGASAAKAVSGTRIPVAGPWVSDLELTYVADAAANDWYGGAGQALRRFEEAFAAHAGVRHALAVPHCTSALHLAMLALDLGPGDEVVVPEATWAATAAPIVYVGATPVFADIDRDSWCVTATSLERVITPRTKALMVVDLYGAIPEMESIEALASARGLPIIEDAAQSVGATYAGRPAGSFGDVGVFSFHGTKTLTTGEGGMLVTDRPHLFEKAAYLRDHCRRPDGFRYFITAEVGQKYKMSALQAAFGLAQLERLDELIAKKRQIFSWYRDRLSDVPGIAMNAESDGLFNAYWMVTVVVDPGYGITNRQMMSYFDSREIDTRPFFPPLSSLPSFANAPDAPAAQARNQVAYGLAPYGLNLPSALLLTEQQIDRVCLAFRQMLHEAAATRK